MKEEINKRQENTIRPVKIRIVNPTPKSDKTNENLTVIESSPKKPAISFLFFILLGCLIVFGIHVFSWFSGHLSFITWKKIILQKLMFLFFAFGAPCFFYLVYHPEILSSMHLKTKPLRLVLTILLALVSANLLSILNTLISFFLNKADILGTLWLKAPYVNYLPAGQLSYNIIFMLTFCLIPAAVQEFGLRQIWLKRNLTLYRHFHLFMIQGLLTALLSFNTQLFIPAFGLGVIGAYLFMSFRQFTLNVVFHFSFQVTFYYLIDKILPFQINTLKSNLLNDYFPLILNILLSLCIFLPILIVISQMTKSNPLWQKSKRIPAKRKRQRERYFGLSFASLVFLYVLFLAIF